MEVYLDYAAATPVDSRVMTAMLPYFTEQFFNPSAPYLPALKVRADYQNAKATIAQTIGAKADQLVMTAGATESLNLAFAGVESVVISGLEHSAVFKLAQSKTSHAVAKITPSGLVDIDDLISKITDQTDLVSVSLVSSDLGTIQPISKIASEVRKIRDRRLARGNQRPLKLHCDASQGLGYLPINVARLGVDLLTLSATKIYGPKQIGCLWIRPGIKVAPLVLGGGQEMALRSGTENVPLVIGFAKAVDLLRKFKTKEVAELRDRLEATILAQIPDVTIIGSPKKRLVNYLVLSFQNIEAERLIYRLENRGVYISTGSACSANRGSGSRALVNLGLSEAERLASVRISLGQLTTAEQIDYATQVIIEEVLAERKWANDYLQNS